MPTYTQIGSAVSVGVLGAATIDFTAIPSTYTDLVLKMSLRTNRVAADIDEALMTFNGATSNFSFRYIWGFGSGTPSSDNGSAQAAIYGISTSDNANTASTFGNLEIYIPNYAGSTNKSFSVDAVTENNATTANTSLLAGLWSSSAAITSIKFAPRIGTLFTQYSTAYLYGVSNA